MKKNRLFDCLARAGWKKWVQIMKLTAFLILLFVVDASASYSQSTKISVKVENGTLSEIFSKIEAQSEYRFFYQNEQIRDVGIKSVDATNKNILDVVNELLKESELSCKLVDRNIIIYPKAENSMDSIIQQQKSVSGKITDSSGAPLPGVSVVIKGTTTGVITDMDGKYILVKVLENVVLQFSFVGMKTQEVKVTGKSTINVTMVEETVGIEEVVAIGYGTMKKSDLTGAVTSVKSNVLNDSPHNNVMQALQGRAAGVQVLQNSGAPGATVQIRIRGTNSIRGSNDPLWIIDGFPGDQTILNVGDIESIEVLKDASATAIYGSRGANGVVIVSTKKGKMGISKVDYDGSFSIQSLIKKMDLMDAKEYMQFYNIQQVNDVGKEYFSQDQINSFVGKGTDWQDLIFRTAPMTNQSLTISGGNEKTQFSVGGGYLGQAGIVENSDYRRITLRANINHNISNKFNLSSNIILSRIDDNHKNSSGNNRGGDLISGTISAAPTVTPYNQDGSYRLLTSTYPFSSNNQINPLAYINEYSGKSYDNSAMANLALTYKPISDLSIKISGNASNSDYRNDDYTTLKYPNSNGIAAIQNSNTLHLNSDNIITYNKTLNNDHNISITGAITYEESTYKYMSVSGSGFLSDIFQTYNIGSASTINTPSTSYSKWSLLSYLGRLNYSYKSKYLATISFRTDGSSRYSKGNKWGYFPSGALAWRISEEKFMKNFSLISNFKLRTGYGETGSTAIDPYYTLDILSSGKTVLGDNLYTYFAPGTRLPGNLKWETTSQTNIGIDVGFFDNRIGITADYYVKNTRDLLNIVQLPASLGYATEIQNIGQIRNRGLELQLNANILNKQLKWDIDANISFNRNKVIKLAGGTDVKGSTINITVLNDYPNIVREGEPLGVFYGYQEIGYDKDGYIIYKDNDGIDGITESDKAIIGNPNPDFIYGITSNLSWNGFHLNIYVQGSQGNDIFCFSNAGQTLDYGYGLNTIKEVLYNHWSEDNLNAKYPRISNKTSTRMSDRFVYDGSYIRLKNIEFSYDLPVKLIGLNWLDHAKIYISGQNLLTITKYPWWDPEVNSYGGSSSVTQGVDLYSYPNAKGFTVGFKLTF